MKPARNTTLQGRARLLMACEGLGARRAAQSGHSNNPWFTVCRTGNRRALRGRRFAPQLTTTLYNRIVDALLRPPRVPSLFVTGTDTGVGKTVVAGAIADWF